MQLPIDVKQLIDEASGIKEARNTHISASIYLDKTAPADCIGHVRSLFAIEAPLAEISITYFDKQSFTVMPDDDFAIIVAGFNESVGEHANTLRESGIPVMVVTTMPLLVNDLSHANGYPIPDGDLIAPIPSLETSITPFIISESEDDESPYEELYELDESNTAVLDQRMGEWLLMACPEKKIGCAFSFPFLRRTLSLDAVNVTSVQNAGLGLLFFLPGPDLPLMTINQAKMVLQIAAYHGHEMDLGRVKEIACVLVSAYFFRNISLKLTKLLPILEVPIKTVVGYGATLLVGHGAIAYFEGGSGLVGLANMAQKGFDRLAGIIGDARRANKEKAETGQSLLSESELVSDLQKRAALARKVSSETVVPVAKAAAQLGADAFTKGIRSITKR